MKMRANDLRRWGDRLLPEGFSRKRYFVYYTVIFAIMAVAVFGIFLFYGKSFIWSNDGWRQHYNALIYYGKWLRSIIRGVLLEGKLEIPAYSFSLGYGSDIITTLHYYVIGDPLTVFAVFVPTKYMAYFYHALILLRLYLSGVAFSLFCFYKTDQMRAEGTAALPSKMAVLVGTFVYVFCGYALFASVRHPYFTNPMIYFPLLLIGAEKILDRKKPWMFIVMALISAVSNFCFFYMIAVLTALYVVWQLVVRYSWKERCNAMKMLCKITGSAILGTCMSAVILIPVIYLFLGDARSASEYVYDAFYTIGNYESSFGNFLTGIGGYNWTYMGYAAIALVAVFLLFLQKGHKDVKIVFLVLTVMTLLPVFGSIMNGFSYVSNRWIWGYSFLVAYILVLKWRALFELTAKDRLRLVLCASAYFLICIVLVKSRSISVCFALGIMFLSVALTSAVQERYGVKWGQLALAICILINISGNALFMYSPRGDDYVERFTDLDDMVTGLKESEAVAIKKASGGDEEFFRYSGSSIDKNRTLYSGQHSTQYYWSLSNGNITSFRMEMALAKELRPSDYKTLDSRTFLSALANVRYYLQTSCVPYGYSKVDKYDVDGDGSNDYTVWENDYYLPFGYTYDSYISQEDYDAMTPLEKQEAMMQGCVIDASEAEGAETDVTLTGTSVPYEITTSSGLSYEDGQITVTKKNATLTLTFDGLENAETYLYVTGLGYSGYSSKELYSDEAWEALSTYDQKEVLYSDKYWVESDTVSVSVSVSDDEGSSASATLSYYTPRYSWHNNLTDFMVNLYYRENACTSIVLTFSTTGEYTFDSLEVLCQPMDNYVEQVTALGEDTLENVDFHENAAYATNQVTGTISLDSTKYLLLTIPYSSGWTAYVDGEEQELLQANTMYMALYLEAGDHEISLVYHTPGLSVGAAVSVVSAAVFVVLIVVSRRKDRRLRSEQRAESSEPVSRSEEESDE